MNGAAVPLHAAPCVVTGAGGFVGGALVGALRKQGRSVVALARRADERAGLRPAPGLGEKACWTPLLEGAREVVHLAARVHIMDERVADPLAEFRAVNVAGSVNLARQAADAGVRRFVFVSTVKVHGESSLPGRPLRETDPLAPADPYAVSKAEAEDALRAVCANSGMELVVVRPPLVYGPGVRANFRNMMRWLARGVPLPLAQVADNRRSLVALDNLVGLIIACLEHPAAAGRCFFAADGEDLSTAELLRRLAVAMECHARLLPVPVWVLRSAAVLAGREDVLRRLCGTLQVDLAAARSTLGWTPPISVDEGLRRAVAGGWA